MISFNKNQLSIVNSAEKLSKASNLTQQVKIIKFRKC